MNNNGIYDRCKRWKENNNISKNKLKEKFEKEESKQCNFAPTIRKIINKDIDDRFIRSETKHLDVYIKRRRNSLEHLEEQKKFEKKIFGKSFEKFSKKVTQLDEFNFSHSKSRKSKDMRNSAINLHKPDTVKDYRRVFNTGNFFNQAIVEFEDNINNKMNWSLNKINNNSFIDFYTKKHNKINKTIKAPSNNFFEKNRKKINENLKMKKFEKKFQNTFKNNQNKDNLQSKINLENKNECLKIEETFKNLMNPINENNIVNTIPADEYNNNNIEMNIEEKLFNKDMNINLNYQLKLNN
jgi:hypothetical protein